LYVNFFFRRGAPCFARSGDRAGAARRPVSRRFLLKAAAVFNKETAPLPRNSSCVLWAPSLIEEV